MRLREGIVSGFGNTSGRLVGIGAAAGCARSAARSQDRPCLEASNQLLDVVGRQRMTEEGSFPVSRGTVVGGIFVEDALSYGRRWRSSRLLARASLF